MPCETPVAALPEPGPTLVLASELGATLLACGATLLRLVETDTPPYLLLSSPTDHAAESIPPGLCFADVVRLVQPAGDAPLERAALIDQIGDRIRAWGVHRLYVTPDLPPAVLAAGLEAARRHRIVLFLFEQDAPLEIDYAVDISSAAAAKQAVCRQLGLPPVRVEAAAALNRFRAIGTGADAVEGCRRFDAEMLHRLVPGDIFGLPLPRATEPHPEWPLISLVVRSMDRSSLRDVIACVGQQTYPRVEMVVVNAKGGGHSPVECARPDILIRLVNASGPALARAAAANAGLAKCTGKFALLLDDDDLIYPNHLLDLYRGLQRVPGRRAAYGGIRVEHHQSDGSVVGIGELSEPFDSRRLLLQNFIPIHAVLFETALFSQEGCRFDESFDLYEDWDFWLQLAEHGDFVHVPGIGGVYRNFSSSGLGMSSSTAARRHLEQLRSKWLRRASAERWAATLDFACDEENPWVRVWRDRLRATEAKLAAAEGLEAVLAERNSRIADVLKERGALELELLAARDEAAALRRYLELMHTSTSWRVTLPLRLLKTALSASSRVFGRLRRMVRAHGGGLTGGIRLLARMAHWVRHHGLRAAVHRALGHLNVPQILQAANGRMPAGTTPCVIDICPAVSPPPLTNSHPPVDIIVCVHNAIDDVRRCLDSVVAHTSAPFRLIVVDDGSGEETRDFVAQFVKNQGGMVLRSDEATGYTFAANRGMRASDAPFLVLLNSDTIVGPEWLDRMLRCAETDPTIAMVGPLSNTASWQSIPLIEENGDWATNPLPEGWSAADMARAVAVDAAPNYPRLGFLNGFCLLIRRDAIDQIGYFDEENFARGYGEENDFSLRLRKAGRTLAVADDVYVYHAQSRSYSHERRRTLGELAGQTLARKHGQALIDELVFGCRTSRVLEGIRARAQRLAERDALRRTGRARFAGRRLLFILPTVDAGGGANVIVSEATRMLRMGVTVELANLETNRDGFGRAYPDLEIPVHYLKTPQDLAALARTRRFDTVIASIYYTVGWLTPLAGSGITLGYYVQDFEPRWFTPGSPEHAEAMSSYTRFPGLIPFCKTRWNRVEVERNTAASCAMIGCSLDVDLFRPRSERPPGRVVVAAMIRPYSPYRAPALTLRLLGRLKAAHPDRCDIATFGVDGDDPDFQAMLPPVPLQHLGKLSPGQLASLLDRADIFVDFSTYQAMGLTAMEAMACGSAVIVPAAGGATEFARHEHNALVVDTSDEEACYRALERLMLDGELRERLARSALHDISGFHPEGAAYAILETLVVPEVRERLAEAV